MLLGIWNQAGDHMRRYLEGFTLADIAAIARGDAPWPECWLGRHRRRRDDPVGRTPARRWRVPRRARRLETAAASSQRWEVGGQRAGERHPLPGDRVVERQLGGVQERAGQPERGAALP